MTDADERDRRRERALWVAREIIPHEAAVRRWLARSRLEAEAIDDLIQEAYCRLALLDAVDHIESPFAYFFSVARSLLIRRLKRERVVPLEAFGEAELVRDDQPSAEAAVAGRIALRRVQEIMAGLPERCRRIVQLRKIEGWSQKRIAQHLGTTEKAVEKQVWLGVRLIRQAWSAAEQDSEDRFRQSASRAGADR